MSVKYDSFIELTPGYESVVDISSDSRNADFWSRYIVNDDMVTAVRLLSKSLRPDDPAEDVVPADGSRSVVEMVTDLIDKIIDNVKTVALRRF